MDAESARMIAELQEKLAAKQTDLSREMEGDGLGDERADQQRKVTYRTDTHPETHGSCSSNKTAVIYNIVSSDILSCFIPYVDTLKSLVYLLFVPCFPSVRSHLSLRSHLFTVVRNMRSVALPWWHLRGNPTRFLTFLILTKTPFDPIGSCTSSTR